MNFRDAWGLEDASTITLPSDSLKTDTPVYFKQGDFADVLGAAANSMWESTGQSGNYTYGESEATAIIYAENTDADKDPDHFTNSNGIDSNGFRTYYDLANGETGIVGDTPLQSPKIGWGSTRELTYHPECTND